MLKDAGFTDVIAEDRTDQVNESHIYNNIETKD